MRYAIWNQLLAAEVEEIAAPAGEDEVCALIERARRQGRHVKAIGGGHSFNDISLCEDVLVDLRHHRGIVAIDPATRLVRVRGGTPLHELVAALEVAGLALANIGAWTEQTIAGALSTATHGSCGRRRRTLIGSLVGMRICDGHGQVRALAGDGLRDLTLGYFGVITEVTLRCEPLFYVRQHKKVMRGDAAIAAIDELLGAHDFVDLRWSGRGRDVIVGRWDVAQQAPSRVDRLARLVEGAQLGGLNRALSVVRAGAIPAGIRERLFDGLGRAYVASGRGIPHGAVWHHGLTFNSLGVAAPHEEREFALPRERAAACLLAVREQMMADPTSVTLEIQIRFSPAVDVRLAPNEGRETVWFNINSLDPAGTPAIVDRLACLALEHGGRPHWGKIVPATTPKVEALYGESALRWEARRREFDPDGLFLNDYYHRVIGLCERSLPESGERPG